MGILHKIENLSSYPKRGRRIAVQETRGEASALRASSAKCRPVESSYVSLGDCFAALQLILSLFGGSGHAGRVTLPMWRPADYPAYDRFTVYGLVPFICSFHDLRLLFIADLRQRHLGILPETIPSRANRQIRSCHV